LTDASPAAAGTMLPPAAVVPGSLGVLGGTFDPIHHGHLAVAEDVRESLGLERVVLIPAAHPPHKPGRPVSAAEHRLAMVELAVAGNPNLSVSPMEVRRGGESYTVDTLEALTVAGERDLWFILSAEALAGFETWRNPERIFDLARLAVVPRPPDPALFAAGRDPAPPVPDAAWIDSRFPHHGDRVRFLPGPLLPISGSVVRRRVAAGRSIRYLVPDPVARYIADHALYSEPA
jgi:nicotinate-nucleotide adenylyltransferase